MGGNGRCSRLLHLVDKPRCGQWQTPFFWHTPSIQLGSHDRLRFSGDGVGKSAHCQGRRCIHVCMGSERERERQIEDIAKLLVFLRPSCNVIHMREDSVCAWRCVIVSLLFLTFDWVEGSQSRILAHAFQRSRHRSHQYLQMQTELLSCTGMTLTSRRYQQTCKSHTVNS